MTIRMLKEPARFVLAALPGTVKREACNVKRGSASKLRPCLGQAASWRARAGWVRSLVFLNILRGCDLITSAIQRIDVLGAPRVMTAWMDYMGCVIDVSPWAPLQLMCAARWSLQVESYWWSFIACSSLPFK